MDSKEVRQTTKLKDIETLAVVGSRTFKNSDLVENVFKNHLVDNITKVVSGGAKGADTQGIINAAKHGIDTEVIKPEWNNNGTCNPRAGFERNSAIVEKSDGVWAFWTLYSKGTYDTIVKAVEQNKPIWITIPSGHSFHLSSLWYSSKYLYLIEEDEVLTMSPSFEILPDKDMISDIYSKLRKIQTFEETIAVTSKKQYLRNVEFFDRLRSELSKTHDVLLLILEN